MYNLALDADVLWRKLWVCSSSGVFGGVATFAPCGSKV